MIFQNIIETINLSNCLEVITLILATYIFNFYYNYFTRTNRLPGPFPLPFIGNYHNYAYDSKRFYEQCQQKYGDISEIMLDRRYIILSKPQYIKDLFGSSAFFPRIPYSQGTVEIGMYGHGIVFNEDQKSWSYNKRFFTESLSIKFMDASIESTNQLFKELSEYWQSLGSQNTSKKKNNNWVLETDFSAWLHGFTNDLISTIITGKRTYSIASYYNTQSDRRSEHPDALIENGDKFVKAILKFVESFVFVMFVNPFMRHYVPIIRDISNYYLKKRKYLFDELDSIITKRRKEIEEMAMDTEKKTDMLTSLIIAKMEDKDIRGNLLDAFLGGTDTTANSFCFITYYICKHPEVKQKMLSEIDFVLSDRFYVSSSDLNKLKYCEAIIKETGRVLTTAGFTFRYVPNECEVAGYKWPAGTYFLLNFYGVHSHPKSWIDPKVFNPDRFYNDSPPDLMIFGLGRRACPGKNLAMNELLSLMALVYKHYNVDLVNINEPLKLFISGITNCKELK
ncbi:20924_t:CDS:2, partial [Racocetra persica]